MQRIRIVGLCLGITLVLIAAAITASASAGTYYACAAQKKGEYTNSTCTTKAAKPHKGSFALSAIEECEPHKKGEYNNNTCTEKSSKPKKGHFETAEGHGYTSRSGMTLLTTAAFGPSNVSCSASSGESAITGTNANVDATVFTGCEFETLPCESAGPNSIPSGVPGVIVTNILDGKLVDHGERGDGHLGLEPAEGEIWDELASSEHEPYLAEFECGGTLFFRVAGSIAGAQTGNTAGDTVDATDPGAISFYEGQGEQGLLTEVNAPETGNTWVGPAESVLGIGEQLLPIVIEPPIIMVAQNKATPGGKKCKLNKKAVANEKCTIVVENEGGAWITIFREESVGKNHEKFALTKQCIPAGKKTKTLGFGALKAAICEAEITLTEEPPAGKFEATYEVEARNFVNLKKKVVDKETVALEAP
jgi:hypothetical protein